MTQQTLHQLLQYLSLISASKSTSITVGYLVRLLDFNLVNEHSSNAVLAHLEANFMLLLFPSFLIYQQLCYT